MEQGDMANSAGKRSNNQKGAARRNHVVAGSLTVVVAGMVGLSFAAVPLYRVFCQVTGYGGTTRKAVQASDRTLAKTIRVRFDANTAKDMPWNFRPVQQIMDVRIGETALAFFKAKNRQAGTIHGTASYNVTPEIAGSYFNKIECFCFTEQILSPGEEVEMPVSFFIDPGIVDDPDARDITEITLSYTFFRTDDKDSKTRDAGKRPVKDDTGS